MRLDPYGGAARWYDRLSGERLVYRAGRLVGLRMLRPQRGQTVLDLGCGTGLNLPLLARALGPTGLILGIDRSPQMLAVAARRPRPGWPTVRLIQADATRLDQEVVRNALAGEGRPGIVDCLVATYALSVMAEPEAAWHRARDLVRPGGRAVVVDTAVPSGLGAVPARLAMRLGGADPEARPWHLLGRDGRDVESRVLRAGHIHVTAGVLPAAAA